MAQGYLYQDARDMFYTMTGTLTTEETILEGHQTAANAVEDLLAFGERKTAILLIPFYQKGMVPQLNTLEAQQAWTNVGGITTNYTLPDDFYVQTSGYLDNGGSVFCPIDIRDSEFREVVVRDPFAAAQTGTAPFQFVPAFIENGELIFQRPPNTQIVNGVVLNYIKLPKYPAGATSDLHASLLEMTVLNMIVNYLSIDGDSVDVALKQNRNDQVRELYQSVIATLGFNPFERTFMSMLEKQ